MTDEIITERAGDGALSDDPEILCTLEETDADGRRVKRTMSMRQFFEEMCRGANCVKWCSYDARTGKFEDETYLYQEDEDDFGVITSDGAEYGWKYEDEQETETGDEE